MTTFHTRFPIPPERTHFDAHLIADEHPGAAALREYWRDHAHDAPATRHETDIIGNHGRAQARHHKAREINRRWRQANPEKEKEGKRQWVQANPEARAAHKHRRRTRKTKAGGSYTAAEFKAIVRHYGGKCLCCGRTDVKLAADHVVPVAKGGSSNIDNIQPLCKSCNSSKGTQTIDYRPDTGLGRWIQRKLFR